MAKNNYQGNVRIGRPRCTACLTVGLMCAISAIIAVIKRTDGLLEHNWWLAGALGGISIACFCVAYYYWNVGTKEQWADEGKCIHCGYDLRKAIDNICPECGQRDETGIDLPPTF